MENKSGFYKVTAWVIIFSLLLQMFPFWPGMVAPRPAVAEAAGGEMFSSLVQTSSPVLPDVLAQPISISRVQSTYQAGGTAVITYTVSNNLPPTLFPDLSAANNVTDTVAILAGIAPEDDLNALYDVSLSLTPLPGATYLDSSFAPSQAAGTFDWDLPIIPPGAAQLLTVTVSLPASSPGFTYLDEGVLVTATAWDTPLAVTARPAVLAPDSIEPAYLLPTAAADLSDGDMLWQSAAFTQDPLAAFYFVRDMGFEPYEGALRGTRGTLWSGAGNSIDQSSLLIAMLRAAGIPARYRHGSLNVAQAQTLLSSLFPAVIGVAGHLPPGTATADPLNDPALLALTQDHWWVEAYLPDLGWTDLDPSFPDAEPGQLFATPAGDGSDQLPVLPDEIHHTVSFALQVEQYTAFPLNGTFLTNSTPLTVTVPTAQLAGKQIAVSQFVTDESMGGAPFTARYITYEPYLTIKENDIAFIGDPFQDVLSNFPLSVLATTAVWLEYTITAPNGQSETFERAIKDLIGPAARLTGGDLDLAFSADSPPFLTADEQYVHWTLPNSVPDWAYQRRLAGMLPTILDLGGQAGNLLDMGGTEFDDLTAAEQTDLMRAAGRFTLANTDVMALTGLRFAWLADAATGMIGDGLQTRFFYSQPRLFAAGTAYDASEGGLMATVDLRTTRMTAIVAPGQSVRAAHTAQWLKGVTESYLEGLVLEAIFEQTAVTTANVFQAMSEAGIEPVLFQPHELYRLEQYPYSEDGKARMSQALLAGRVVLAPAEMVELNGEPALAWWEIDPLTGETISVGENGLHVSALTYKLLEMLLEEVIMQLLEYLLGFLLEFVSNGYITSHDPVGLAEMLMPIGQSLNDIFMQLAEFFQSIFMTTHTLAAESGGADWLFMPAHLCPVDNCGVEQFFLTGHMASIPLPDMLFAYPEGITAVPMARSMVIVVAGDPPGDPDFTLTANPDSSTVTPGAAAEFQAEIAANFDSNFEIYGYAPFGWDLTVDPTGNVTAWPAPQTMPGEYVVLLAARPQLHPDLMATAVHTVTVNPLHEVALSLSAEPNLTVPMGEPAFAAVSNQTNDAEAEMPQAAYTVLLENRSDASRTYDLTVSGPPPGWVILNGARQAATAVTLAPGAKTQIGLYIQPDPADVPTPGLSFPIEVTAVAQDDPTLTDMDSAVFTMPGQPFNYLTVDTAVIYAMPGTQVEFNLTVQNVGNSAGTFPLSAALPLPTWSLSGLPDDVTLAVGQTETAVLTLTAGDVEVGRNYRLLLAGSAPDSYTQYLPLPVQIVSANSGPIFQQADHLAAACPLAEPQLSAALHALALAINDLERACDAGSCPQPLRAQVVTAAQQAANYGRLASPLVQTHTDLEAAAAELAGATSDDAILDALPGITTAITSLTGEICAISQHRPSLRLTPWMDAALPDQPVNYDLQLTNRGTLTTTYAVTVTLPGETLNFQQTINPNATENTAIPVSASDLALYLIEAEVRAINVPIDYLTAQAEARLNVVDRFIQVTAVTADPPFVETGESSTTLQAEIANIAGIGLSSEVETAVYSPNGTLQWNDTIPLNILGGAPRLYDLVEVDTSGWAAGVYTITADVQLQGQSTTGGAGYGYLSVGQAVIPSHAVQPDLVAPGTVTVTTLITTEINQLSMVNGQSSMVNESRRYTIYDAPYWHVQELADRPFVNVEETGPSEVPAIGLLPTPVPGAELVEETAVVLQEEELRPFTYTPPDAPEPLDAQPEAAADETEAAVESPALFSQGSLSTIGDSFFRVEQDDPAISYTGSWSNINHSRASGGSYWRNATAGSTAELTFDGDWLNVGFIGTHWGGYVDISINGDSQGAFDLYRREDNTPVSFVFAGLGAGPHTVTLTVTGDSNPFSLGTRVQLDYIDYWDGAPLGHGLFEEDDVRVLRSGGWTDVTFAGASGGGYMRGGAVTAWFPFDGDSFTYYAMAYNGARSAHLFVDGQYLDTVDLYHTGNATNAITRTFSYDGFGPGPHILQIQSYRDQTTVDALQTPGQPPFIDPNPAPGSVNRYEEDHPATRYNGVPYTQTAQSWSRISGIVAGSASDSQYLRSQTAGDAISFDFEGSWLNLGFYGDRFSGYAEVFIDGNSQGIVDLYRREETLISFFFPDLTPGSHTLTITVLGNSNPFAANTRVQFDYVDFGDGTGLDHGAFEEDDARILRNVTGWITESNANASGGSFIRSGSGSAWFYFEGDSFAYQAMAYNQANRARLYVNGQYLDTLHLFHPNNLANAITRTFSYEGFGPGPHLLQISAYRGQTTLDAITTPGVGPFIDPNPPVTGITRFEEDHPAIRYNGAPFTRTAASWTRADGIVATRASDSQYIHSNTAGDTISFDFEGSWIGVGFATNRFSGEAEIAVDGNVMAVVDLYTREDDTESFYFSDLGAGAHTITITVLGTSHPNATNTQIYLDYFDVWDGQPLAEGLFEETDERIFYSGGWFHTLNEGASGGAYANSGASNSTAWFPFTGDSVTFESWTTKDLHSLELRLDGVSLGYFSSYSFEAGSRAFSFAGLGDGPHVLEVRRYRGAVTVDAFTTPATGEHYELPPLDGGVIRLEEDHPDLRFNGYRARQMPQSWSMVSTLRESSDGWAARAGTVGDTLSLDFEGTWVGVGFYSLSNSGVAEIFVDGQSQGTFDISGGVGGHYSVYFDDLGEGTHTLLVTLVSGFIHVDFIDTWDGQPIENGWYDANLEDYSGRFHFSQKGWWWRYENQYAHEGDFLAQTLPGANPNMWFTFVGNDLTILGFNRANAILDIAIDGEYLGEFDMTAEFSDQPYALHFPDLGDGPHVVHIHTRQAGRIDAFEVNPDAFYSYTPQITWYDATGTEELDPGFTHTGFVTTIGIGDLNGDGNVELVAPGVNGRLYVYRGDGQDAGDGTPILWTSDLVGPAAEPALADLTGDGLAEIIVTGYYGTFAFRHDGTLLWQEDSLKSFHSSSSETFGWGGPTVGNLDDDPHPEIVIAAYDDALYVLDHMGNILDSDPLPGQWPTVPVLADISGDGSLDIVVAQGHTLKVYEYDALAGLEILWTYTLTQTTFRSGTFGGPAVADLTGDGQPEIVINWGHRIEAIKADGSLYWSYYTEDDRHFRPSPVTVADVTGDGEINLITASAVDGWVLVYGHDMMVLTKEGELVWMQNLDDRTASASGVAAQDLTGDGVWEILWNGSHDGFLILRGSDGKRLFNEPFTGSGTIIEYPTLGDVDGDGVADVVLAGREGIFVISHVGHWANSRPMWNQHNYHVTNINDDWSTPVNPPNSWEVHNTYRTQTPEQNPAPSYRVEVTHTVGVSNVTVLTDTFSAPPTGTPPVYAWQYQLEWYDPVNTISFNSELAGMQPGETRQINQGTEISYRLPSGWNYLTLPPLYVTAARILDIVPAEQLVGVGSTAVYTLTLLNPGLTADLYSLDVDGLPAGWLSYPSQVNVPAQSSVVVHLEVTAPADAELEERPFLVTATTGSGGQDMATASLTLFNGLQIAIDPPEQTAPTGTAVTYTLTLTNNQPSTVNYQLSTDGLAQADLPNEVEIAGETAVSIPVIVTSDTHGPLPFSVTAAEGGGNGTVTAVLHAVGYYAVGLALDPASSVAGPATPALFDLTVTNLGDAADSYDLSLDLPSGWSAALDANGTPVDSLSLPPHIFNSTSLRLLVTPDVTATPGDYEFSVTAVSQSGPGVQATITGMVEVLPLGVQVAIEPQQTTMSPLENGLWQITITNTGTVADSFDLTAAGIISLTAEFSSSSVSLGPGQSQTVQMSSGPLPFALPQTYPFWVMAASQTNAQIVNYDEAAVTFTGYEAVEVAWLPASQTVTDTLSATYMLIITNTGNILTQYQVALEMPGLSGQLPLDELPIPARSTAALPLTVYAGGPGTYTLLATAVSDQGTTAGDTAVLTVVGEQGENQPPIVNAGPDQTIHVGETLSGILVTFTDPDLLDTHTAVIDWGDGTISDGLVDQAAGTVSGSHLYEAYGNYTVTITVTDNYGGQGSDTFEVTVRPYTLWLPYISSNN
jgi:uncharacterized membrane protein